MSDVERIFGAQNLTCRIFPGRRRGFICCGGRGKHGLAHRLGHGNDLMPQPLVLHVAHADPRVGIQGKPEDLRAGSTVAVLELPHADGHAVDGWVVIYGLDGGNSNDARPWRFPYVDPSLKQIMP
jgi:hypothetical protein